MVTSYTTAWCSLPIAALSPRSPMITAQMIITRCLHVPMTHLVSTATHSTESVSVAAMQ
ncbi:hypothetical protein E2C01_069882 [Portunus trituberculatus]|uniref:Uncharacterized protein n=1 Tax=Portunus trituberculatus TaxID=210409 RepID=A0A5B7HVR1_PORTR|nr:hypothetical protein [Portunus trituberculatus]